MTAAASLGSSVPERTVLDAAVAGDEDAFRSLVEPSRGALHAHCYRMLGSVHDAEDALQDTLLRAWRGLPRFDAGRPLRPWLYRIATNACLDIIARRSKRILPFDRSPAASPGEPLPEAVWIEPYPDDQLRFQDESAGPEARYEQREAVELAFIAALQHLPARQRAVLILRDVLSFSARETADMLDTTVPSVNSTLQRARKATRERLPSRSQQTTLRILGSRQTQQIIQRFIDAFESGDVGAILGLLAEDAAFAMPPYPDWCRGHDAIADSWLIPEGPPSRLRYLPTRANGQLAFGIYRFDPPADRYRPIALEVLALRGADIVEVTAFRTPGIVPRFGLPEDVPMSSTHPASTS